MNWNRILDWVSENWIIVFVYLVFGFYAVDFVLRGFIK